MTDKNEEDELTFKIITIGNSGVGKTSIIRRFVFDKFNLNTISTVGLLFSFKDIIVKDNISIKLKIIDTGGQEKYRSLSKSYYKNADGVFFVFDLSDRNTFDEIQTWINLFQENNNGNEKIPQFLIGNKCDLKKGIDINLINKFADKNKLKYFETSAKDNISISEIFQKIGEILYEEYERSGKGKKTQLKLQVKDKKKKWCCTVKGDVFMD